MSAIGIPIPIWSLVNSSGAPVSGALINAWVPASDGTPTATRRTLYTNAQLTVEASNPIAAGTSGHKVLYRSPGIGVVITVTSADAGTTYATVYYPADLSVSASAADLPSIIEYGGIGDGAHEAEDCQAANDAIADRNGFILPFYNADGDAAQWNLKDIVLPDNSAVIGDPRYSQVIQGAGKLFIIDGDHVTIKNLVINQAAATGTSDTTFHFNTSNGGMSGGRIEHILAGIDRDRLTLRGGYRLVDDDAHASNIVVDTHFHDIIVFGARASPYYLRDFFASILFRDCVVDFTRQSAAPQYAGWDTDGGEGLLWDQCYVQGFGTSGTGHASGHGWNCANGAALAWQECRADGVGGIGFRVDNVGGVEMVKIVAGHNGEGQIYIEDCTLVELSWIYCGGRSGLGWAPTTKHGLHIKDSDRSIVRNIRATGNTGSGVYVDSCSGVQIGGFDLTSNGAYGLQEANSSDFGLYGPGLFNANTTNNRILTGAGSALADLILTSGSLVDSSAPGAGAG